VAYKPEGMNFHSEEEAGFVVKVSEALNLPLFSVHRLDKMTSGLVILAKSSSVAATFTKLFESRQIEKYYLAISVRRAKKKQGWIKGDMALSRRGSYKLLKSSQNPAITQFKSFALRPNERLYLVKPHTGKTHQIRVALKSLGAPITGDVRYAQADEARLEERGYLHAYALKFSIEGEDFTFVQSPYEGERFLSEKFQDILMNLEKPWELF